MKQQEQAAQQVEQDSQHLVKQHSNSKRHKPERSHRTTDGHAIKHKPEVQQSHKQCATKDSDLYHDQSRQHRDLKLHGSQHRHSQRHDRHKQPSSHVSNSRSSRTSKHHSRQSKQYQELRSRRGKCLMSKAAFTHSCCLAKL